MSDRVYGTAVHGAGDVSTQHVRAYLNNPHSRLVAISSRTEESARKLANKYGLKDVKFYTDYGKLLDDPDVDIISICTPQHLHSSEVIRGAQAKKHMLIEKPVAVNLEELYAMERAVRVAGVKTVVSFVLRWNRVVETVKSLLSKDFFGKVFYVEADFESYAWEPVAERWEWMRSRETGISSFLVAGIHAIDMARWLSDTRAGSAAKIVEVVSYSGGYRKGALLPPFESGVTGASDRGTAEKLVPPLEYDGLEVMIVKFENGALGKISSNFDAVMPYNFSWKVYGDEGTCKNNKIWSKRTGQADWTTIEHSLPDSSSVSAQAFQGEINHLIECIMSNEESHCSLAKAVNTHEAAFGAIISRANGNVPVKLPLTA